MEWTLKILCRLLALAVLNGSSIILAGPFDTVPEDSIPWEYPLPKRTIVIGDIHADSDALRAILMHTKIIDENDRWIAGERQIIDEKDRGIAGETHLVLLGDLNGRGPSSRRVYDLVIRLSKEAPAWGGRVHALLGNHELLVHQLDFRYPSLTECEEWREFAKFRSDMNEVGKFMPFETTAEKAYAVAMTRRNPYADFNINRNTIIKLGSFLFVHGGLGDWIDENSPGEINATVRHWLEHYQGKRGLPDDRYGWVLGGAGPLWDREISTRRRPTKYVKDRLRKVGATKAVVGHVVTKSRKIEVAHGGHWVMIDTGISRTMGGKLSALEIDHSPALRFHWTPKWG